jgi:hypothetical protein
MTRRWDFALDLMICKNGGNKESSWANRQSPLRSRHPLPSSHHGDGQTNGIKFIPFVCSSQVHASPPTSATIEQPSSHHGDGQTNWIKFIPFVCPSQVHASPPPSATIEQPSSTVYPATPAFAHSTDCLFAQCQCNELMN